MFRLTGRVLTVCGVCIAAVALSSLACQPYPASAPTTAPLIGATTASPPSATQLPAVTATISTNPTPTPEPVVEKERPQRTPTPATSDGTDRFAQLTVINDLDVTACYIYISPTTEDTWGEDWLGATEMLAAGRERTFDLTAGAWDLLATDCDQKELAQKMQVSIQQPLRWWLSTSTIAP